MMKQQYIFKYTFLLALLALWFQGMARPSSEKIEWTGIQTQSVDGGQITLLTFRDADNADEFGLLPVYSKKYSIPAPGLTYEFELSNPKFEALEISGDPNDIEDIGLIQEDIYWWTEKVTFRGGQFIVFRLLPLRYNQQLQKYEKLISFDLNQRIVPGGDFKQSDEKYRYAENSVLANGDWYKIAVTENGVYKVTWRQLQEMGFDVAGLDSDMIRLFGNGGGMLPQRNDEPRHDDLQENAIVVVDGDDGTFDDGDYFMFYGQSPHTWKYNELRDLFEHTKNRFSDSTYYFVTIGPDPGKRVQPIPQSQIPAEQIYDTYQDFAAHELETRSLIKSGAEWYGEEFNDQLSQDFYFPFPNRVTSEQVHFKGDFVARSTKVSHFSIWANGDSILTDNVSAIPENSITKYANASNKSIWFHTDDTPNLNITLTFDKPDDNSIGWLNYIELNVTSYLQYPGDQFLFRNTKSASPGQISEFRISNPSQDMMVWDITDPLLPGQVNVTLQQNMCTFTIPTDSVLEFVAFDPGNLKSPSLSARIPNQNLHAYHSADFIIVSHPDFHDQAVRLKELHEEIDGMEVIEADINEIYNEFSSGLPDVTAIRDFVRMVYHRSGNPPKLKYLLLFGDGSYDPKNRVDGNEFYIPTFQSNQSIWYTSSYVTDDYFGLMDDEEGNDASGNVDLGIGRFPVNNIEDAILMVDKVEDYLRMGSDVKGMWRNSLCFIADDEDYNLHLYQADTVLVKDIQRKNKSVNINKIYFDAYKQETTASGQTYPGANADINRQVNEGTLIVNYTGHGGELGLSHEHVVQISDIISWDNQHTLPVFITATCEFSRFDNPILTSAGELVLLNPNGGGIALLTTTRLAFASSNLLLNKRIYDTLFRAYPYAHPRLGDLMMFSKNPSNTNIRNFVLLGNPALKLGLPGYNIVTDSINGVPAGQFADTLNANSTVTVSGFIEDVDNRGIAVEGFNGILNAILYDKPSDITTLGNDPKSSPYEFQVQNSVLCKGKASVKNGRFSMSFVLPLDISYQFGSGKLSFYASDSIYDAAGYFSELMIGGFNDGSSADNTGPEIELFLNDSTFVQGMQVNPQPILFARLSDPSGINSVGTGIGHDIVLTMDGSAYKSVILNDLFEPAIDDHSSGTIFLPLDRMANGEHTIQLKAWDMFNNSSVAEINFIVSDSIDVNLLQVYNYPNPFRDHTWFTFRHNQFEGDLTTEINIYNFYGQHVRTIGPENVFTNGYGIEPLYWDGKNEGGARMLPGIYLYTIKVTNEKGQHAERIQKMIITK